MPANLNPFTELITDTVGVTNADTDGNGDTEVTFDGLTQIESASDVSVNAVGGYTANVQSVSGNVATVRIFESAGSAAAHSAVASGTDVTDLEAQAIGQ